MSGRDCMWWRWILGAVLAVGVAALAGDGRRADAAETGPTFSYTGDSGPYFWGDLSEDWTVCHGAGGRQSPIDITRAAPDAALQPLRLDTRSTHISLINNGHTIELEYEEGSTIIWDGVVYDLLQFHYHTLSEHTIGGVRYPMEQHAVFKNGATGNIVVVGQMFEIGNSSPFLANFTSLPKYSGNEVHSSARIDLADGLVNTAFYYTYPGSLTTPPCSEVVTWIMLADVAQMSTAQFEAFRNVMGNNFRPTQPRPESFFVRSR